MYLNVLMRTNNRPAGFQAQLKLLEKDPPDRIIISVHNMETLSYVEEYKKKSQLNISIVDVEKTMKSSQSHFKYNLYINDLIDNVDQGFIWCIDDDDLISSDAISYIKKNCIDQTKLYIVKMNLMNKILPRHWKKRPVLGDIGTPNFIVFHELAKKAKWHDQNHADGEYLQNLYDKTSTEFLDKILYTVKKANFGKS